MISNLEVVMNKHEEIMKDEDTRFDVLVNIFLSSDIEALKYYHSKGYDMNPRNHILYTPVHYLNEDNTIEFVELLEGMGVNLFAIDISGTTVLHEDAMFSDKLLVYLLSKGLNPYQKDFEEYDLFGYAQDGDEVNIELAREKSMHSGSISRKEALTNKNYSLAMKIVETEIFNLGGFKTLLSKKHIQNSMVREYLNEVYFIFLLNKKYKEAFELMKHVSTIGVAVAMRCWNNYPFLYDAAFLMGDKEELRKLIERNIVKTKEFAHDEANMVGYLLARHFEDFDKDTLKTLKGNISKVVGYKSGYLSEFTPLVLKESPFEVEIAKNTIEETTEREKPIAHPERTVTRYYLIGLFYLLEKDYINAEYMFNQCIQVVENEEEFSLSEFAQSHAMIDYIQMIKEG